MESKNIFLGSRSEFGIAVNSLHREYQRQPSEVIRFDTYNNFAGSGVRYLGQIVAQLVPTGDYQGIAIFDQRNIWGVNAWSNDEIFDMSILVLSAISSRFVFPRNPSDPQKGNWHYADMAVALQSWARVPTDDDTELFSKNE